MLIDITTEFDAWLKIPGIETLIKTAARAAVNNCGQKFQTQAELSILLTSDNAIQKLNSEYRNQDKPTNVLSFPGEQEAQAQDRSFLLGDVVLSYQTIGSEAKRQNKRLENHISHLIVHGVLHLLGYDHEDDETACDMERKEINILKGIGVENPYALEH